MREFGNYIPGVMGPANPNDVLRSQEKADKPLVVEVVNSQSNNGGIVAGSHDLRSGYGTNLIKKGNI